MKKRWRWGSVLVLFCLLVSCNPISEGQNPYAQLNDSSELWMEEERILLPKEYDEEEELGGVEVLLGEKGIQFEENEVYSLQQEGETLYACERKGGECGGAGAFLLRWDPEEQDRRKVADVCSCEGSRSLVANGTVFSLQTCSEGTVAGLYRYEPETKERSLLFEGELLELGRNGETIYFVKWDAQRALFERYGYSLETGEVETAGECPFPLGERWMASKGRQVFFTADRVLCFLPERLLTVLDFSSGEAKSYTLKAEIVTVSENFAFFSQGTGVYRLDPERGTVIKLGDSPVGTEARGMLALSDERVAVLWQERLVDLLLWRCSFSPYCSYGVGDPFFRGIAVLSQVRELTMSELPFLIGFPPTEKE